MTAKGKQADVEIKARKRGDLLFEYYAYSRGRVEPFPAHSHPEYQIALSIDSSGRYDYRGSCRDVPKMALSVIQSGVAHKPSRTDNFDRPCRFRILYVPPAVLSAAAREVSGRGSGDLPVFPDLMIDHAPLTNRFVQLCQSADAGERLAFDVRQSEFLSQLVRHSSSLRGEPRKFRSSPRAIKIAREYLDAHFTEAISLAELARVTQVSKYHLCHEFREAVGVSPHIYQNQLRLDQAKRLLAQKRSIAEVAYELGFFDQSHFGRHFKRFSGVTPRQYASSASSS